MADRRATRRVGQLLAVVAALLALGVVALMVFQRSLIFFPDAGRLPPAATVLPGGRDVTTTTADGLELTSWYVPAPSGCAATVLVAHGNGGNLAGRADLARGIADRGFGVLLLGYRGYGGNPGSPSEQGLALDARAALAFLEEDGVPARDVVYYGESIGTGVVSELAVEHPPAAMVLRSPFTSLADAGRAAYGVPVGWLLRDHFRVREHVARSAVPLAVVYGSADRIVPAEQSRQVARAAREAGVHVVEVEVPGADHNDVVLGLGPTVLDALVEVAREGGAPPCP